MTPGSRKKIKRKIYFKDDDDTTSLRLYSKVVTRQSRSEVLPAPEGPVRQNKGECITFTFAKNGGGHYFWVYLEHGYP